MEKIPMTQTGFTRMEKELKNLKSVERPSVIAAISEARAHGDLKENAEYHAAKEKQSFIEGRIQELEAVISRAEIIDVRALTGDTVKFGATVTVVDEETEEEVKYQIVGDYEADIKRGLISTSAPIGRALIGKKMGSSVEVVTPKGARFYEVVTVEFIE
ncbi:MAG: transcription elongation factor GreA [Rickettsiales bacterium]